MGRKDDGQKEFVVDNAKHFVSNRQRLGVKSPGSHNNTKTGNNQNTAANTGQHDPAG